MPISVMNLMIGLAVGDIKEERDLAGNYLTKSKVSGRDRGGTVSTFFQNRGYS